MNQKQLACQRNQNARLYQCPKSNLPRQRNCLHFGSGDFEHELRKFYLCWAAHVLGHEWVTEARGKDGNIRDFVDLDTGANVEVETDKKRSERFKGTPVKVWEVWDETH